MVLQHHHSWHEIGTICGYGQLKYKEICCHCLRFADIKEENQEIEARLN
jgi:hypothetical protein